MRKQVLHPSDEVLTSPSQPNPILIGQGHAEEILRARLATLNVYVELGMELIEFDQDETGVRARVVRRGPDSDQIQVIPAKWIVSAEGGKSELLKGPLFASYVLIIPPIGVIRKQLGLTFLGESHDDVRFVVADLYVRGLSNDVSLVLILKGESRMLILSSGILGGIKILECTYFSTVANVQIADTSTG